MCKNADNPCPGCTRHEKPDAAWMFFTEEERLTFDRTKEAPSLVDRHS